jgi:hypothetical protein
VEKLDKIGYVKKERRVRFQRLAPFQLSYFGQTSMAPHPRPGFNGSKVPKGKIFSTGSYPASIAGT